MDRIGRLQLSVLNRLMTTSRLQRLAESEARASDKVYTLDELFSDLTRGIFIEVKGKLVPDAYRRNLQRVYLDRLIELMPSRVWIFRGWPNVSWYNCTNPFAAWGAERKENHTTKS